MSWTLREYQYSGSKKPRARNVRWPAQGHIPGLNGHQRLRGREREGAQGGEPTMLRDNERSGEVGQKGNSSFAMSVHLKGLFNLLQQSENLSAL